MTGHFIHIHSCPVSKQRNTLLQILEINSLGPLWTLHLYPVQPVKFLITAREKLCYDSGMVLPVFLFVSDTVFHYVAWKPHFLPQLQKSCYHTATMFDYILSGWGFLSLIKIWSIWSIRSAEKHKATCFFSVICIFCLFVCSVFLTLITCQTSKK